MSRAAPERLDGAPPDRFDTILEGLLLVLLVFAPLALGVVQAWSELVVVLLSGALALCLALKFLLRREERPVRTWAYLPLVLFLLLALFQLLPLPRALVQLLSPHTLAVKQELLADLPGAAGNLDTVAISFYADGTLHDLRLALAVAAVFAAAVQVYRRPAAVRRLLATIAILGAALALLAIAQILSGSAKIYWSIPSGRGIARGGPFVNRNNFCQFMNLSLGAVLALLLLKINDGLRWVPKTLPAVLDWFTSPRARWVWFLVGGFVLGMAAIFLSLSRGGVIALLLAATLTALVMAVRRRLDGRAWIMATLALAAFVCVLFLGFDAIYDRLATLEEDTAYASRWQIVENVARAWTEFPLAGTGFGTHEVVFPMFDRASSPALFAYAENEYAQMAEETGLLGLALVAAFGLVIWFAYRRCLRSGGEFTAVAYGLGFALVAVMVQSLSDFGMHFPANSCLAATFCGALVGLAATARHSAGGAAQARARRPRMRPLLAPLGAVAVALVWGWALLSAQQAQAAEARWNHAERLERWIQERDWLAADEDYRELISNAAAAVEHRPGKVQYRYGLAVYRWHALKRVEDAQSGRVVPVPSLGPQGLEYLRRIVADLHEARALCPSYGLVYCIAGQFEYFRLDQRAAGARHIRQGYKLAPCNPTVCFVSGWLDVVENHLDTALAKFQRALELDAGLFREIAQVLIEGAGKPELAVDLAGDDYRRLLLLEARLSTNPECSALAVDVRAKATAALKRVCERPDAPAGPLAQLGARYHRSKRLEDAETCYRRALDLDYGNAGWRLELAHILAEEGKTTEAIDQAHISRHFASQSQKRAADKLIGDLSVPSSPPKKIRSSPPERNK